MFTFHPPSSHCHPTLFPSLFPPLLTGVCSAGSYPLSCRLPANTSHRHGYHAGENYYHKEGLHHICAGISSSSSSSLPPSLPLSLLPSVPPSLLFLSRPSYPSSSRPPPPLAPSPLPVLPLSSLSSSLRYHSPTFIINKFVEGWRELIVGHPAANFRVLLILRVII